LRGLYADSRSRRTGCVRYGAVRGYRTDHSALRRAGLGTGSLRRAGTVCTERVVVVVGPTALHDFVRPAGHVSRHFCLGCPWVGCGCGKARARARGRRVVLWGRVGGERQAAGCVPPNPLCHCYWAAGIPRRVMRRVARGTEVRGGGASGGHRLSPQARKRTRHAQREQGSSCTFPATEEPGSSRTPARMPRPHGRAPFTSLPRLAASFAPPRGQAPVTVM
jgi:hypothetical protein